MAINLSKGSRINLTKNVDDSNSEKVESINIGVNWGKITVKSTGFFGLSKSEHKESVDLDLSVLLYDENKRLVDTVFYGNLSSRGGSIRHSGDDRVGDDENDGKDNEVIRINLSKVSKNVAYMVFILNSYSGQSFDQVPYANVKVRDGKLNEMASYELSNDEYKGNLAIVLGHIYRRGDWWKFKADGVATREKRISEISVNSAVSVL